VVHHSSRLEQVEDRISKLEEKIKIKEKNQKYSYLNNSKAMKGILKNSATPKNKPKNHWH
jgi:hypothetical protein